MSTSKLPYILFGLILLIAALARLYRIEDYMTFLGDEGRDVLVVKRMIVDKEFTLLGPITSVGLMHLGPMYYYFMLPFLWVSRLNPVGPAVMVSLFSLGTIFLIWKLCREFLNTQIAEIASLLYTLSPLVIIHSRTSWNPNILPFWGLLFIYSFTKVTIDNKYNWLFVSGIAFGVAIQLHYIALAYIPIGFAILFIKKFKVPLKYYVFGLIGIIISLSPFIIFEIRHKFINTLTIINFITRGGDAKTFGIFPIFYLFWDLSVRLFWRLVVIENAKISILVLLTTFVVIIYYIATKKNSRFRQTVTVLLLWYVVGLGTLSFYTGNIYDYYLTFVFSLPFILVGLTIYFIMRLKYGKVIAFSLMLMLIFFQLRHSPLAKEPNWLAFQTKEIADFILQKTGGQPYNFALLAPGNSDHAYRYYLEVDGYRPVIIENEIVDPNRISVTDQLFIVCEEKICQPLGHPLWEIAGFGRAEIVDEWQVGLFTIYKLVHYIDNGEEKY